MAYKQKFKLTPRNYKKYGYDYYYKIGKKHKFTIETDEGDEEIFDEQGKYEGAMS